MAQNTESVCTSSNSSSSACDSVEILKKTNGSLRDVLKNVPVQSLVFVCELCNVGIDYTELRRHVNLHKLQLLRRLTALKQAAQMVGSNQNQNQPQNPNPNQVQDLKCQSELKCRSPTFSPPPPPFRKPHRKKSYVMDETRRWVSSLRNITTGSGSGSDGESPKSLSPSLSPPLSSSSQCPGKSFPDTEPEMICCEPEIPDTLDVDVDEGGWSQSQSQSDDTSSINSDESNLSILSALLHSKPANKWTGNGSSRNIFELEDRIARRRERKRRRGRRTFVSCEICNYQFAKPSYLVSHQLYAHKVEVSKDCRWCPGCGSKFENVKELYKHSMNEQCC